MVGETIKDLAGKDAGEESEGVAQLLDPGRFEVGEDEVARSQLHGLWMCFWLAAPAATHARGRAASMRGRWEL